MKKLQDDMKRAQEIAEQQRRKMAEDLKREEDRLAQQRAVAAAMKTCDECGRSYPKGNIWTSDGRNYCCGVKDCCADSHMMSLMFKN